MSFRIRGIGITLSICLVLCHMRGVIWALVSCFLFILVRKIDELSCISEQNLLEVPMVIKQAGFRCVTVSPLKNW